MKLKLSILAAVLCWTVTVFALSDSDAFTGTNGTDLTTTGWTQQSTFGFTIQSNHADATGSAQDNFLFRTAGTWSNDQESSATFTITDGSYMGVTVRASGTGGSAARYYFLTNCSSFSALGKTTAGSNSSISTSFAHPASGSVVTLRVVGTTLTVYDDGVSIGSFTDSDVASGNPGIYGNDSGGSASYVDDWAGNDIGGGATPCLRSLLGIGCEVQLFSQRMRR